MQWRFLFSFIAVLIGCLLIPDLSDARRRPRSAGPAPTIRFIIIQAKNVFDPKIPGEDHWPYTWVNAAHITTRNSVVRRELLFKTGDPADKDVLDESERILRALPFIKEARIRTVPVGNGRVDVVVETNDAWTTQPQIDFGSEGGRSHFSAGVLEENFLGYGKSVSVFYRDRDLEGASREYSYNDPQLFGSRVRLGTSFEDKPSGDKERLEITRPFYSLETRHAGGTNWNHFNELQRRIENGIETTQYFRQTQDLDAFYGFRVYRRPFNIHRLSVHYFFQEDQFNASAGTAAGTLPTNKRRSGFAPRWDWLQDDFIKETFIDRAERVEDINLGHQAHLQVGYAPRSLGSTDDTVPFSLADQFGFGSEGEGFGLTSLGTVGRYNTYHSRQVGGQLFNTLYFWNANYYHHLPTEFPFTGVVHMESAYVRGIDQENQLELGGDTGLRGFKASSFTGNKSLLVNMEGRAYYPHEVLHLAYLGGAFFVDAGQVQPAGQGFRHQDMRASIGVGLRVALTRSTEGGVYRFDVAYALGKVNDNRIVFSISSGQGFNRNANTFAKFPDLPIAKD